MICDNTFHVRCITHVPNDDNSQIACNNSWICKSCLECELPFIHFEDDINFLRALSECWLSPESVTLKSLEEKLFEPFVLNDSDSEIPILGADPDLQYYSNNEHADDLLNCSYYVESTLIKNIVWTKIYFQVFQLNVRSIPKNLKALEMYMNNLAVCFTVVCITETW